MRRQADSIGSALALLVWLVLCLSGTVAAGGSLPVLIGQAELTGLQGTRVVTLPHRLDTTDHDPEGSTVRYRLRVMLDRLPDKPLALYVPRVALSADMHVNGQWAAACGTLPLERLRCLHLPQLFGIAPGLLRLGENTIDLNVHATSRQANGLSAVQLGDKAALAETVYRRQWLATAGVYRALAWLSASVGLIALLVGIRLRDDPVFVWFAAAAIVNAFAQLNWVLTEVRIPPDLFSFLSFASRGVSGPLALIALIAAFGRLDASRRLVRLLLGLVLIVPVVIALGDSQPEVAALAVLPTMILGLAMTARAPFWAWRDPQAVNILLAGVLGVMATASVLDWLRLLDVVDVLGQYVLGYAFSLMILVIGGSLFLRLVRAMRMAQEFGTLLEHRVAERTAQLQEALTRLSNLETAALRLTNNIPAGTFVAREGADRALSVVFVSDPLRRMLNLPATGLPMDPLVVAAMIHPEDRHTFHRPVARPDEDRAEWTWEGRILQGGAVRHVLLRALRTRQPDGGAIWDGVCLDVTAIHEADARMKAASAALFEATLERTRSDERDRLLQDMHDGFGSQLASARLAVERGGMTPAQIAALLEECAADLRIMVDTLGNDGGSLADALADFRYRTEARLHGSGIRTEWRLDLCRDSQGEATLRLSPRVVLQLLRLLQEAFTNALRHAGAGCIAVSVLESVRDGHPVLTAMVEDDGRGLQPDAVSGRGLTNMRRRCRELGASLDLVALDPGLRVVIRMETARAA